MRTTGADHGCGPLERSRDTDSTHVIPTEAAITGTLEGANGDAGQAVAADPAAPQAGDADACPICEQTWAGADHGPCICSDVFHETKRVIGVRGALERGGHVDDEDLADFECYTHRRVGLIDLHVVAGAPARRDASTPGRDHLLGRDPGRWAERFPAVCRRRGRLR